MTFSTCSYIKHRINSASELQEYVRELTELRDCIRLIYRRWLEYEEILDIQTIRGNDSVSYCACTLINATSGARRPRFSIDKDQLELDLHGLRLQNCWE